jgi:hypothetical protein
MSSPDLEVGSLRRVQIRVSGSMHWLLSIVQFLMTEFAPI